MFVTYIWHHWICQISTHSPLTQRAKISERLKTKENKNNPSETKVKAESSFYFLKFVSRLKMAASSASVGVVILVFILLYSNAAAASDTGRFKFPRWPSPPRCRQVNRIGFPARKWPFKCGMFERQSGSNRNPAAPVRPV